MASKIYKTPGFWLALLIALFLVGLVLFLWKGGPYQTSNTW